MYSTPKKVKQQIPLWESLKKYGKTMTSRFAAEPLESGLLPAWVLSRTQHSDTKTWRSPSSMKILFLELTHILLWKFFVSNVHIMYSSIINLSLYIYNIPTHDPSGTSLLSRWRHLALTNCGCLEALGNNCNPSNMALVQPICCMVSEAWKPRISRGRRGKKPRTSAGFFCISSANLNLNKIHIM